MRNYSDTALSGKTTTTTKHPPPESDTAKSLKLEN
jgi:hypothetical protein